jgi:hypothetical protein
MHCPKEKHHHQLLLNVGMKDMEQDLKTSYQENI